MDAFYQTKRHPTPEQGKFARLYVWRKNAVEAYCEAFGTPRGGKAQAERYARLMLSTDRMRAYVRAAKRQYIDRSLMDVKEVMARFSDIATADPRKLVNLRIGACRHCHGVGFNYQWREREYVEALHKWERKGAKKNEPAPDLSGGMGYKSFVDPNPDCPECGGEGVERIVPTDTTKLDPKDAVLFNGVKATKHGYEIVMANQHKALEALTRMMGGFKDTVQFNGALVAANVVATLPEDASAEQASEAYQKMIATLMTK